ncbi:hypothetical protein ACQ4M4_16655 [Leptolyngbya sp. AN02str]|uniref:hypothetical protein n=1 Tax=Leptolyngbya sp. AN02str TaxID=3423363 RepID=UPI003D3161C6
MNRSSDPLADLISQPFSHPYLARIDPTLLKTLNEQQLAILDEVLETLTPKRAPKLVDLRLTVDVIISRFYIVLLVGKDQRKTMRSYLGTNFTRTLNIFIAALLLIGLNLSISAFFILTAYLIKSALGIDLFAFHLKDIVAKF